MNELREFINKTAEEIQPKLKPLAYRKDRNAYAHIYGVIKNVCGVSYSEADPRQVRLILKAIEYEPNATTGEIIEIIRAGKVGSFETVDEPSDQTN